LHAFDQYAESLGFPPYSAMIDPRGDPHPDESGNNWISQDADGRPWAIMTNFSVTAVPVEGIISLTRLQRLDLLLKHYGQHVTDYAEEVEEDLRPYFNDERELERYCCITSHEGKFFFLPEFASVEGAQARAEEYMFDDLFQEIPVAVVDLDTGGSYRPTSFHVEWKFIPAVEGATA
jgi:hypothetical protein